MIDGVTVPTRPMPPAPRRRGASRVDLPASPVPNYPPPRPRLLPGSPLRRNVIAAGLALAAAALVVIGAAMTWYRIELGGVTAPGGEATGFEGNDGLTVAVAAGVGALVAVALLFGRRDLWCKVLLLVAGGVTVVISAAGIVDASAKADKVSDEFGVPAGRIAAEVGPGLWLVLAGGATDLAAGSVVRRLGAGT